MTKSKRKEGRWGAKPKSRHTGGGNPGQVDRRGPRGRPAQAQGGEGAGRRCGGRASKLPSVLSLPRAHMPRSGLCLEMGLPWQCVRMGPGFVHCEWCPCKKGTLETDMQGDRSGTPRASVSPGGWRRGPEPTPHHSHVGPADPGLDLRLVEQEVVEAVTAAWRSSRRLCVFLPLSFLPKPFLALPTAHLVWGRQGNGAPGGTILLIGSNLPRFLGRSQQEALEGPAGNPGDKQEAGQNGE